MKKLIVFVFLIAAANPVLAITYWPTTVLTDWELYLNNGVAYILSSQIASHCSYNRAQINMSGTEFDKALYAYALSAKARNKAIKYVTDDTQTVCVIRGLREAE